MNTAPKISRAIISKKNFSQLRGTDDCNGSAELDNQSTLATSLQTTAETRNSGKIKLLANKLLNKKINSQYSK